MRRPPRPSSRVLLAVLVLIAGAVPGAQPRVPTAEPAARDWARGVVRVDSGPLQGARDGDVLALKGIPYAAPPVGPRRWQPPAPVQPWTAPRDAARFGPACPQALAELMLDDIGPTSEDCLTLNVWTAARRPGERRAVLVWVHGGAYLQGAASQRPYDGAALAARGVVVVSLNYRLGVFGFFAHPALSRESGRDASGNQGLRDIVAALQWVRRNAAAVGGDPQRVTVFGESSGAGAVNALLTSPLAAGLFHRAILQSGSVLGPVQHLRETWYLLPSAESIGASVQGALDVPGAPTAEALAAMRARDTAAVLAAATPQKPFGLGGHRYAPVVDGDVLPEEPAAAIDAGRMARVPIVAGANEDEGTVFLGLFGPTTPFSYAQLATFAYGSRAQEVLRLFPASTNEEARLALARSLGIAAFVAPARRLAAGVSRHGVPAYLYHFTRRRPGEAGTRLGAFHGSEIPYAFGTLIARDLPGLGHLGVDEADRRLSEAMMRYWIAFAEGGVPAAEGLPEWPRVDAAAPRALELGQEVGARPAPHAEACDVFDAAWTEWRGRRQ